MNLSPRNGRSCACGSPILRAGGWSAQACALVRQCARLLLWLATGLATGLGALVQAHEIPADVRLKAYVWTEGPVLQMALRVPLAAMREVDVPVTPQGYLDLERADEKLREAAELWLLDQIRLLDNGTPLPRPHLAAARISLAADAAFARRESALEHLRAAPLPPGTQIHWREQWMDVLLQWPAPVADGNLELDVGLARLGLRVATRVHFTAADGTEHLFELHGHRSSVRLDPRWHQSALSFARLGVEHILSGIDHLLFLLALVIPVRRLGPLVAVVTAFTLAHSVTLVATALGHAPQALWFGPLVETLVAASIVWLCIENLLVASPALGRRLTAAFVFGLAHGFAFATALQQEMQFAGRHLLTALLSFNLGVEAGQLAVLLVVMPALGLAWRAVPPRAGGIVLSALVAHTAWHWLLERGEVLAKFPPSTWDEASVAALLRWLLAALLGAWALHGVHGRWQRRRERSPG